MRQELKHGGASSDSGEVDIFDDYMEQLKHAPSVKVTVHLDRRIRLISDIKIFQSYAEKLLLSEFASSFSEWYTK